MQYILVMEEVKFALVLPRLEVWLTSWLMQIHCAIRSKMRKLIDLLSGFMSQYPELSLTTPEATSVARAHGFNKLAVTQFFNILHAVVDEHGFILNNSDDNGAK